MVKIYTVLLIVSCAVSCEIAESQQSNRSSGNPITVQS